MKKTLLIVLMLMVGIILFAKLGVSYDDVIRGLTRDFKMEMATISGKDVYSGAYKLMELEIVGNKNSVDNSSFFFELSKIVSENLYVFTVMDQWLENTLRYYMGGVSEVSAKVTDMMYSDQKEIILKRGRYTIQINSDTMDGVRWFRILIK